jgi:hypothetical protein
LHAALHVRKACAYAEAGALWLQADGQAYSSSDSARAVVDDGDQYTGPSPRNTHPCSPRQAGIPERF